MARRKSRRAGGSAGGGPARGRQPSVPGTAAGAPATKPAARVVALTGRTRKAAARPAASQAQPASAGQAVALEDLLRDLGGDVEMVEREVFDGTRKVVAHLRRQPSAVRNVNQEAQERMSALDKAALFVTNRVGTFGFFLIILGWTVIWLSFNTLGPKQWRWDPAPAFVLWLFISNMIQIFLMPLLMVGQNLQGRHSELRAEADFDVNKKAEQEVEAILLHLEQQAAQIERQGELILEILGTLRASRQEPRQQRNDAEQDGTNRDDASGEAAMAQVVANNKTSAATRARA